MEAKVAVNESERLARLRSFEILDTGPEGVFDTITQLAAHVCHTPIAIVCFIDEYRQWFKSRVGVENTETPRCDSFCAHAILENDDLFIVSDATKDARFRDNPLVTGPPFIRFYAGAVLRTSDGMALGTLHVVDTVPREMDEPQARALRALASQVLAEMERRRASSQLAATLKDLKKTEEQFWQSQKMEGIGRLAGGVAHDFNNLLMIITGNAQIIHESLDEKDPLRASCRDILGASATAASVIRQLLAFSRKQTIAPSLVDVNALIAETSSMLRHLISENIELQVKPAASVDTIQADPTQLQQIIMNLTVNARDAMPQGGTLRIETANHDLDGQIALSHPAGKTGKWVELCVSDTGTGMDEHTRKHLFDPFYTTKGVGKGTGLGLSTVYGIVRQSGGSITVDSALGRGTRFRIFFPAARQRVFEPEKSPTSQASPSGGETILVVEDQDQLRKVTASFLKSKGYVVHEASNGLHALAVFSQNPCVDLLVTDVVMPDMGGKELVQRLRDANPALRFLYTTGYTRPEDEQNPRAELLNAPFLQKPFDLNRLATVVRELLDGRDSRDGVQHRAALK